MYQANQKTAGTMMQIGKAMEMDMEMETSRIRWFLGDVAKPLSD